MKKIFGIFVLVGILRGLTGVELSAGNNNDNSTKSYASSIGTEAPVPVFTYIDGNIFLAVDSRKNLDVSEGAIVEFSFGKKKKIKSFHVNDINQNIIDKGDADLFVMIHHDLALSLKSNKLIGIKIIDGGNIYRINVDQDWQPHKLIANL